MRRESGGAAKVIAATCVAIMGFGFGCSGDDPQTVSGQPDSGSLSVAPPELSRQFVPASAFASLELTKLQRRFTYTSASYSEVGNEPTTKQVPALPPGIIEQFERDEHQLYPVVPEDLAQRSVRPAKVILPAKADGRARVEDVRSGAVVEFWLDDARRVDVEIADGLAFYPAAGPGDTHLIRRVDADGVEDYVEFETKPSLERVSYTVDVTRVDGLRLVGNVLEFMRDGHAALRMAAPYVVGADGRRHIGGISVEGCAYDTTGVVEPGYVAVAPGAETCTAVVSWSPSERPGCARKDGSDDCSNVAYPALLDPYWSSTGSMAWTRYFFPTVNYASWSGHYVYVFGGSDGTNDLAYVEERASGSSSWSSVSPMSTARRAAEGGYFWSGASEGFVIGGGFTGSTAVSTGARLVNGVWAPTGALSGGPRAQAKSAELPSGKVMLIGGSYDGTAVGQLATTTVYDYATNAWTAGPSMSSARVGHTVTNASGTFVVIGGWNGSAVVKTAEKYTEGGSWVAAGSMAAARFRHSALLVGSKVLVAGGTSDLWDATRIIHASAEFYTPSNNTFAAAGNMKQPRELFSLLSLSGRAVAAGGRNGLTTYTRTADVFNGTATWAAIDSMALVHWHGGEASTNPPMVFGGKTNATATTNVTELFNLLPNGSSCSTATAFVCDSGYCVDGVCCNTACGSACDSCNQTGSVGTCKASPAASSGSPACANGYACNGTAVTCPATCASDNHCAASYYCNAASACVARKASGLSCNLAAGQNCKVANCRACTSGYCVDGTCCQNACTTTCKSCANSTGACTTNVAKQTEDTNSSPTCSGTNSCDGAGVCKKDNGQTCGLASECASGFCVDGRCCTDACTTTCKSCANTAGTCTTNVAKYTEDPSSSPVCSGVNSCDGAGACKKDTGQTCSLASECASGYCVDGRCCADACTTTCKSCANTAGTCTTNLAKYTEDANSSPLCSGTSSCDGAGVCKKDNGQTCSLASECASGYCVDGRCCESSCTTSCKSCANAAGTCTTNLAKYAEDTNSSPLCSGVNSCDGAGICKKDNGQTCSLATECASGNCLDGYCCTDTCTTTCKSCANASGSCTTNVAKLQDDTNSSPTCSGSSTCDGSGACKKDNGQTCLSGSDCASNHCVDGYCCADACATTCKSCANAAGTCTTNIVKLSEDPNGSPACIGVNSCDGAGTCKKDNGQTCAAGTECSSGFCADGKCCNSACGNPCDSCDVAGVEGTCTISPKGTQTCNGYACDGAISSCPTVCASDLGCADTHYCASNGTCQPRKASASACNPLAGQDCNNSNCRVCNTGLTCSDGYCCTSACDGQCDECATTPGTCSLIPVGEPGQPVCANGATCNGTGNACPGGCSSDSECSTGYYCSAAGQCLARKTQGVACDPAAGADCLQAGCNVCSTGQCVDGACCTSACGEPCGTCAGTSGSCHAEPPGTISAACSPYVCNGLTLACPSQCDYDGQCDPTSYCTSAKECVAKQPSGQSCSTPNQCQSGYCVDGTCCANACTTACKSCANATGTCTTNVAKYQLDLNAATPCSGIESCDGEGTCLLNNGQPCSAPGLCSSGFCVDGNCCENACTTTCKSCASPSGTCTVNVDQGNADTNGSPACQGDQFCDGLGTCKKVQGQSCTASNECLTGFCSDGVCCDQACSGTCDACDQAGFEGTCRLRAEGEPACGAFVCDGISSQCPSACPGDRLCHPNYYCAKGGSCEPRKNVGASCSDISGGDCVEGGCRVCNSGHCADNVCCSTACSGQCDECASNAGTCLPMASGQSGSPACGGSACNGSATSCPGGCTTDSQCVTGFYCNASGACVAKKNNGEACDAGAGQDCLQGDCGVCLSGNCVDGFCCNAACSGPCDSCSSNPGTCVFSVIGAPGTPSCAPFVCTGQSASCPTSCSNNQACLPDRYCAAGQCLPKGALGASCTSGDACTSGICTDGVCCDAYCSGACDRCNVPGALGTCVNITGPGIPGCNGYICNSTSASCPASCNTDADCDTGYHCNSGQCEAKQPNGIACTQNTDCSSNFCVDGVCCDSLCNGTCQSCVAAYTGLATDGLCGSVVQGEDPRGVCAESSVDTCDFSGACDGQGSCALYPLGTQCKPAGCEQNSATGYACDGQGACLSATSSDCGLAKCSEGACPSTCAQDDDCTSAAYCNSSNSACVQRSAAGESCQAGRTCLTGYCADGVCCNATCEGQCESCAEAASLGTCMPVTGEPRGDRGQCAAAAGSNVCEARACDGKDRTTCAGYAPSSVVCAPAACADGFATLEASCDGAGQCAEKPPIKCEPYVCQGDHCGSKCASNDDCATKFRCDPGVMDCVALEAAICDLDGLTLRSPDGSTIDCSPYRCEGSACKTDCNNSSDCVAGFVCDTSAGQPRCVSAEAFSGGAGEEGGCGCRTAGSSSRLPYGLAAIGLAALALTRRRGRRRGHA